MIKIQQCLKIIVACQGDEEKKKSLRQITKGIFPGQVPWHIVLLF
jgi:hypothetical protein